MGRMEGGRERGMGDVGWGTGNGGWGMGDGRQMRARRETVDRE